MPNSPTNFLNENDIHKDLNKNNDSWNIEWWIPVTWALEWIDDYRNKKSSEIISFRICDQYIHHNRKNIMKNTNKDDVSLSFRHFFDFINNVSKKDINIITEEQSTRRNIIWIKDISKVWITPDSEYKQFFWTLWKQYEVKEFVWSSSITQWGWWCHRVFFYNLTWSSILNIVLISSEHLTR